MIPDRFFRVLLVFGLGIAPLLAPLPTRAQEEGVGVASFRDGSFRAESSLAPPSLASPPVFSDNAAVWSAAVMARVLADRDYPTALALAAVQRVAARNRTVFDEEIETLARLVGPYPGEIRGQTAEMDATLLRLRQVRAELDRCRTLSDPVEGTLCTLEVLTPSVSPSLARELAEEGARLVALYLRPGQPMPPGIGGVPVRVPFGGEGVRYDPLQRFLEEVLVESENRGGQIRGLDLLIGIPRDLGEEAILARVPELGRRVRAEPLPEAGQSDLVHWAAERAYVYLSARSATLAGAEREAAERMRAVGNALADLRREGTAFRANLIEVGQRAASLALRTHAFTVAAGLAGFFEGTPAAFGGVATQDLRALRTEVDALQKEMETGFEGLDLRFDELFDGLDRRFGALERMVGAQHREVRDELRSLRAELDGLGRRVDRLDANVATYLQAGFDRDHLRTLIRCLEHRARVLPPFDRMEFPMFSACLTDFRVRGAQDARDALLADRTTPVEDLALAEALLDLSPENLARRLPLLARVAEQRLGVRSLHGGRGGANPLEWAVAAQAYLRLLQDWPELAQSITSGDLEALLATGVELQDILRGILEDPVTGERGVLLERSLQLYADRVAELREEADLLAHRYQQAQLRRVDPATLLTHFQPEASPPHLPLAPLEVPRWMAAWIPQEVRTAAVLALEEPRLVYRLESEDQVERENLRRRWGLFGRRHDRLTFTRTRLEAELRVGAEALATFRVEGPRVLLRVEEMAGGFESESVRRVRPVLSSREAHFLGEIWPELAEEPQFWRVSPPRAERIAQIESSVAAELRRFESVSLNRVFRAACQTGPLNGVAGPDLDSALRLRSALQGLTSARLLLSAYVRLALPEESAQGPDALLDQKALCGTVDDAGENPFRRVWLEEEPQRRTAAAAAAIAVALDEPVVWAGALSSVETTLQQLRAAIRIQRIRTQGVGQDRGTDF